MDIVEYVCKILNLSREEAIKNSKILDEKLTYYWNPAKGGLSLIVDKNGNYLGASSSINPEELLKEYKKGEKVKNLFTEFYVMVNEYTVSPENKGDEILYGVNDGKVFKSGRSDGIIDENKIENIKNVITNNLEKIKALSGQPTQNYKGGRQEILKIKINGDTYFLIGNTSDPEMKALYQQLKNEISKIIFE